LSPPYARGTEINTAVLTEEDVVEIRCLYAEGGVSYSDLALDFNVDRTTIGAIVRRETWAWVE
jgi:predicted DNA-binding ArsR family transcriptional regulator